MEDSIYSALRRQYLLFRREEGMPWSTKHHKNQIFCCTLPTKLSTASSCPKRKSKGNNNLKSIRNDTYWKGKRIDDSGSYLPFILLKFSRWSHTATRLIQASLEWKCILEVTLARFFCNICDFFFLWASAPGNIYCQVNYWATGEASVLQERLIFSDHPKSCMSYRQATNSACNRPLLNVSQRSTCCRLTSSADQVLQGTPDHSFSSRRSSDTQERPRTEQRPSGCRPAPGIPPPVQVSAPRTGGERADRTRPVKPDSQKPFPGCFYPRRSTGGGEAGVRNRRLSLMHLDPLPRIPTADWARGGGLPAQAGTAARAGGGGGILAPCSSGAGGAGGGRAGL